MPSGVAAGPEQSNEDTYSRCKKHAHTSLLIFGGNVVDSARGADLTEGRKQPSCFSRVEVFAPYEMGIVHAIDGFVRCCISMGDNPLTGKNFEVPHRPRDSLSDITHRLFSVPVLSQT